MAAFLPGVNLPQVVFRVAEVAGKGIPRIDSRFDQEWDTPGSELLMHSMDMITVLNLDSRHGAPATPLHWSRRQAQVALHMIHLPQGEGDAGGEEVGKTRGHPAQLESDVIAIEPDGALQILDQQADVADPEFGPGSLRTVLTLALRFIHGSA